MNTGAYPFERPEDRNDAGKLQKMIQRILQVKYDTPKHISAECADLLRRILVPDPNKRLTIPQIQDHPWYLKDLPSGVKEMNNDLRTPTAGLQVRAGALQQQQVPSAFHPCDVAPVHHSRRRRFWLFCRRHSRRHRPWPTAQTRTHTLMTRCRMRRCTNHPTTSSGQTMLSHDDDRMWLTGVQRRVMVLLAVLSTRQRCSCIRTVISRCATCDFCLLLLLLLCLWFIEIVVLLTTSNAQSV